VIYLNRKLVECYGKETELFLQGLITQDIYKNEGYGLILTPQGKFFADLFFFKKDGKIYLDIGADRVFDDLNRFKMYRLRSDVNWNVLEDVKVYNSDLKQSSFHIMQDSRHLEMGFRLYSHEHYDGEHNKYLLKRISLGIAEDEMIVGKSIPLEFRMDEFNAIDFNKGCYMGQELTARTHYRQLIKKKIYSIKCLESGIIFTEDGIEAGETLVFLNGHALAIIRCEFNKNLLNISGCPIFYVDNMNKK
jgi:folate-binding protein YgfZ